MGAAFDLDRRSTAYSAALRQPFVYGRLGQELLGVQRPITPIPALVTAWRR